MLAVLLLGLGLAVTGCVFSAPRYQGPKTNHFDGNTFHNEVEVPRKGLADFLKWQSQSNRGYWSKYRQFSPGPKPADRVEGGKIQVTFINHATVLVQMDGLNILTDPIWSERCSPVSFLGPRRVRPPGIRFEDLPPIDIVLISHNHYDHLDIPTLERLESVHRPRIFAGLGNAQLLEANGLRAARDLDWWQHVELKPGVTLTSVPAQHFSNRGLTDRNATLWTGYVVKGPSGNVYFAGDTGMGPHFRQIRERFGPMRLSMLPIGAFRPEWFMASVHTSPEEALEAHRILESSTSVAIHFGTFALADDGEFEPPRRLTWALTRSGTPIPRFWVLGFGEGREVP